LKRRKNNVIDGNNNNNGKAKVFTYCFHIKMIEQEAGYFIFVIIEISMAPPIAHKSCIDFPFIL
jgi:hypothetical protein